MLDPFILRALTAGLGVALIAGAIGCFVVWRRMAYFGDSLAHSAFLGIAFGIGVGIGMNLGSMIVCAVFAALLLWLQQQRVLATDTLLGILAHAALSVGMITISALEVPVDLRSYLFGDILTVTSHELLWLYGGGVLVMTLLLYNWSSLVLMTIDEDLAVAENVNAFAMHVLFMALMTIVVAVSIRIIGILLITSILIIPAATARQLARSPEGMAVVASLLGALAISGGIFASMAFDIPSGPSIVAASATLFALLFPFARLLEAPSD